MKREYQLRGMIVIFSAAMLSACGMNAEQSVAHGLLEKAIENGQSSSSDTWTSYQQIRTAERKLLSVCWSQELCDKAIFDKADAEQRRLVAQSIKDGNPKALARLYVNDEGSPVDALQHVDMDALRQSSVTKLLSIADQAKGTKEDAPLLFSAGKVVAEGQLTQRDANKAVGYFARAYAAGEIQAANEAAMVFRSINDYRNAYLWSLRCTAECRHGFNVQLDTLQQSLTPEAVKQAQQIAANPTIVDMDTSGG